MYYKNRRAYILAIPVGDIKGFMILENVLSCFKPSYRSVQIRQDNSKTHILIGPLHALYSTALEQKPLRRRLSSYFYIFFEKTRF